jgi:hypothetical protein
MTSLHANAGYMSTCADVPPLSPVDVEKRKCVAKASISRCGSPLSPSLLDMDHTPS